MNTTNRAVFGRSFLTLATLGVLAVSGVEAQQQQQQQRVVTINYRKTLPGKGADQRKFAETHWKKWTQALVDDGATQSAMVLRLTAPYAAGAPADYAIVTSPSKRPSLAQPDRNRFEALAKKAGFASVQAYLDMINANSSIVKTEWLNTAISLGNIQAGNYLRSARFMVDPDHMSEQMQWLQHEMVKLNTQNIKDGRNVAWGVSTLHPMVTSSDEAGFNLSIFNVVKDADSMWNGPGQMTEERFKRAFPTGMNLSNYLNRQRSMNSHRKTISTRIWEVVAVVGNTPQITPPPTQ